MKMTENKKTSILLVLKVLEEYSDENHFLTHQNIIDKISELYGIELERKSIANSIMLLEELDYDIEKGPKGGFALFSRILESSEVNYLVDALFSSKSISGKHANELANKLSSLRSRYERKSFSYLNKSTEVNRTNNAEVFFNVEIIHEAIEKKKWISFKYLGYDKEGNEAYRFDGYEFKTSPCYLINNFGKYYYLGYRENHDSVSSYRIDYMKEVKIIDKERLDPKALKEFKNYHNISEYINDHIYMFGGKVSDVVMELNEPRVIQYINDWFGKSAEIYFKDDKLYAKVRCNENAFFYWSMQYSEHITVISPQSIIDRIKQASETISSKYIQTIDTKE